MRGHRAPDLLRQIGETEAVISARYHNLVLALIQNKPVIALSDHAKLDSVVIDLGLAQYLLSLRNLNCDVLIDRFKQLENDAEVLRPHLKAELEKYRQALDALFTALLTASLESSWSPGNPRPSNGIVSVSVGLPEQTDSYEPPGA